MTLSHIADEFEQCIKCGLCVQITERECEPLGLAFIGRGFEVRIDVPFDEGLERALHTTANEVVQACPTGALTFINQEEQFKASE